MKTSKINLKFSQKDKLADFSVNMSVAWFVGSIITPFFFTPQNLDSLSFILRTLSGLTIGGGFLYSSLKLMGERN